MFIQVEVVGIGYLGLLVLGSTDGDEDYSRNGAGSASNRLTKKGCRVIGLVCEFLITVSGLVSLCLSAGIFTKGTGSHTQRLQKPLIKEYTLNHIRGPTII